MSSCIFACMWYDELVRTTKEIIGCPADKERNHD